MHKVVLKKAESGEESDRRENGKLEEVRVLLLHEKIYIRNSLNSHLPKPFNVNTSCET